MKRPADESKALVERFRQIVPFLSVFETPEFCAGEIIPPKEIEPDVFTFPYARLSAAAEAFVKAAYDSGLVLTDFDWPKWARTSAAKRFRTSEEAVARATPQTLARLLTACIRQDRFAEGSLLSDFQSGLIVRIIRRAAALLSEAQPNGL